MSSGARLDAIRGRSVRELGRLAFRKAVYRKVSMARYEVRAGDSEPPATASPHCIEMLGPDRFEEVLGTNPYLEAADVERFRLQDSTCIAAFDGERIAASTWMTRGDVHVQELHRTVRVPEQEHFSCRSYVDPDYRGQFLLSHMVHEHSRRQAADDVVWGLIYAWNEHSIRAFERLGWRHTGEYWTRFVAGRKFPGETLFPPRPPSTLG